MRSLCAMTVGGRQGSGRRPRYGRRQDPLLNARTNTYQTAQARGAERAVPPGEPLREVQVAEWCGVSRTPVREALQRLEQDGLVCWDGPNLIVRRRSPEEILDLYSTRIVLESAAAGFAADRRTDHDLRQLRWALDRADSVAPGSIPEMVEANRAFNRRVWEASHNKSLVDLLERLALHLGRYPETTLGLARAVGAEQGGARAALRGDRGARRRHGARDRRAALHARRARSGCRSSPRRTPASDGAAWRRPRLGPAQGRAIVMVRSWLMSRIA